MHPKYNKNVHKVTFNTADSVRTFEIGRGMVISTIVEVLLKI
jgi:hypothetical protein